MNDDEPLELPDEQEALRALLADTLTDATAGKDEARQVLQLAAAMDGDDGYLWLLLQTLELLVDSDLDESKRRVALTLNASARMVALLSRHLAPHIDSTPREVLEAVASGEDLGWWLTTPERVTR